MQQLGMPEHGYLARSSSRWIGDLPLVQLQVFFQPFFSLGFLLGSTGCGIDGLACGVPEQLRHAFLSDQKYMYGLLMKTVASAVMDLVRDERRIGATPGILMLLHTWTSQMMYHPHVHLLITAGGVSDVCCSCRSAGNNSRRN
jgi:hypothetical protein